MRRRLAPLLATLLVFGTAKATDAQSPSAPGPGPLTGDPVVGLEAGDPLQTTLVHPPFGHTLGIQRARAVHLKIFLGDRTRFDDPQGVAAVKFAASDDPREEKDDYQLTLFGVNSGRGEIIYNSSMQTLALFGGEGSEAGSFRSPHGIAATVDGRVYVADTGNRRIARLRWDPVDRSLRWIGTWPADRPFDVAFDARGNLWTSDRGEGAVLRYADSTAGAGTELLPPSPVEADRWPLPDDVADPLGIAVGDSLDPWYRPREYRLYLVDHDGQRLAGYDAAGRRVARTTPGEISGPGAAGRFFYLALDHFGNVYATDPVSGAVHKFDPELGHLTTFSGPGPVERDLEEPRGIAIWKRFGQVFVAEREGAQYFFIGTDFVVNEPVEVRRTSNPETIGIDLFLTEAATVSAAFLDAAGDTLALADAGRWPAGAVSVRWGARQWVRKPTEGWWERVRRVAIDARPTYSSRKKFRRRRTVEVARRNLDPYSERR